MQRDTSLDATQLSYLKIISSSGEHLLDLIDDVLDMAKIEAGRITLNEHPFDLHYLLNSLEEMLNFKAKAKNLQLLFTSNPEVPQYIQTDEAKLRQVLINLLSNAIKFTPSGSVTLQVKTQSACRDKGNPQSLCLRFEVADTGPGIAAQELDSLFAPFVQTEVGRQYQSGTGLGLAISRKFVQLLGGDINVSTALGQGSIFRFSIPVSSAQITEVLPKQIKRRVIALAPNQPQYRILVAEDKWESRKLLRKLLEPLGFEVREAQNGQEAVAIWESWLPT